MRWGGVEQMKASNKGIQGTLLQKLKKKKKEFVMEINDQKINLQSPSKQTKQLQSQKLSME